MYPFRQQLWASTKIRMELNVKPLSSAAHDRMPVQFGFVQVEPQAGLISELIKTVFDGESHVENRISPRNIIKRELLAEEVWNSRHDVGRGDRGDWAIEIAVELTPNKINPARVFTE